MEIKYAIALASMFILLAPVLAQNTYIPLELGGDNYYRGFRKTKLIEMFIYY